MKTEVYNPQCIYHLSNLKAAKIFSYHIDPDNLFTNIRVLHNPFLKSISQIFTFLPFFKILKGIHKPILENTYKIIDKLI